MRYGGNTASCQALACGFCSSCSGSRYSCNLQYVSRHWFCRSCYESGMDGRLCRSHVSFLKQTALINAQSIFRNATLGCDSTLYRMAGQLDMYYWSEDNLTALCTESCLSDSSSWVGNVGDACVGQTYNVGGKLAPVDTVALRYVEGVTMACLLSK